MALRQQIEWDPEEVAAGYDLSSIYKEVDNNSTAPVISSVVNTTDQAGHSAFNITAVVREVMDHVVKMAVNTTLNSTTTTPTTVAPPSSSAPSTISTVMKKVVEHLGREPSSPVATVCIFFLKTLNKIYYGTAQYTLYSILQNRIFFTSSYSI